MMGIRLLLGILLGIGCALVPLRAAEPQEPLRFGLTPVILDDQISFLEDWKAYLEERLGRRVELVQRRRYLEITNMLHRGELDFAWICGYPYVENAGELEPLTVPYFRGEPTYRSLLIVPAEDQETGHITDLEGGIFAFADRHSNSGYLVPRVVLARQGKAPGTFFRKAFFTWSHHDVIEAVRKGVADGGAVDSYVYRTLEKLDPGATAGTRVAWSSPEFGFPPVVTQPDVGDEARRRMRAVLEGMAESTEGRRLLEELNLDRFGAPPEGLYRGIEEQVRELRKLTGDSAP